MSGCVTENRNPGGALRRALSRLLEYLPLGLVKFSTPGLCVEARVLVRAPDRLVLGRNVTIQRHCIIHCGGRKWCGYGGGVVLEDNVVIGPDCILYGAGELRLGTYTHLGPKVIIMTQSGLPSNNRMTPNPDHLLEPITIGKGCWIGAGAVILGGTVLGDGCTVGPNAVVKGEYPDNTVLIGNPARASVVTRKK